MKFIQEFPRGDKFYAVQPKHHDTLDSLLSKKFLESASFTLDALNKANHLNSDYLGTNGLNAIRYAKMLDNEVYPKIEVRRTFLAGIMYGNHVTIQHRKATFQTAQRFTKMDSMPYFGDKIIIRWDPVRKGIIRYDVPYEGPLINNKPKKIGDELIAYIEEQLSEIGIFELLGEDMYTEYSSAFGSSSANKDILIEEKLINFISGNYTVEDVKDLALATGAYIARYDSNVKWVPNGGPNYTYQPYKLTFSGKPVLSTTTRTRMVYRMGGYTLPEDYQEWFDG